MKSWMILVILCVFFTVPTLAQEVRQGTPELAEIVFGHGALARHTLCVIDDDGNPVVEAKIQMSFVMPGCQWINGLTDTNGNFAAQGKSCGEVNYDVKKSGYYSSGDTLNIGNKEGVVVKDGKWQPWNPKTTVVLRRIVNPIPMYAKKVETFIPDMGRGFGFDLIAGDWVVPNGSGVVADFTFRIDGFWTDYRNNDSILTLGFRSVKDGISLVSENQTFGNGNNSGSVFILPRHTPENGFVRIHRWRRARTSKSGNGMDDIIDDPQHQQHYVFRIRSETNNIGLVKSAIYGKIRGNIEFIGVAPKGHGSWIKFTYYLNPTPNDRNMEFDPKRNLFKKLNSLEEVTEP